MGLTVWQKMMNDIFSNKDFIESFMIDNEIYSCVVSPITDNLEYSDGGLVNTENFTLDLKLPVFKIPKKNDKLIFRDQKYKIDNVVTDSAFSSIKLYIVAMSKGV